jgi:hypothetical protein
LCLDRAGGTPAPGSLCPKIFDSREDFFLREMACGKP